MKKRPELVRLLWPNDAKMPQMSFYHRNDSEAFFSKTWKELESFPRRVVYYSGFRLLITSVFPFYSLHFSLKFKRFSKEISAQLALRYGGKLTIELGRA